MATYRFNKKATPRVLPTRNQIEQFFSSDLSPAAPAIVDRSGNVLRLGGLTHKDFRLLKVTTVLNGTVSYTPTDGVSALFVEAWGAGGAGGGVATAATNSGAAGGGGGGAYSNAWIIASVAGAHTVAVGLGGVAGAAGANAGVAGGDTLFKDTTGGGAVNLVLAKGGLGGLPDTVAAIHAGGLGGAGGLASAGTGDTKLNGHPGFAGIALAAAQAVSGMGGGGMDGKGAGISAIAQGAGGAALSFGAGGAGGCILSGGANVIGGVGFNGLLLIWEFA